jgi:hypothetical protein
MANTFLNFPIPVGNGPGAAVNTSAMGKVKSVIVGGTFPGATIRLEASNDGGATWGPVLTFQAEGKLVTHLAAQFMRVYVLGRQSGLPFSANVDVGSNDDGGIFAILPMPVGNGAGAAVSTSGMGTFKTVIASGSMDGATITAEISEDGISWEPLGESFYNVGGVQSNEGVAEFMRVVVSGRNPVVPFSVVVSVGAINDDGGTGALTVQDEGAPVGTRPILNFIGAGVTATDDPGNNRVNVTIPGGNTPLSDDTPIEVDASAGGPGVATEVSRADHRHQALIGDPVTVRGDTNDPGAADELSRADHLHRLELEVLDEGALEGARPAVNFIGPNVEAVDNPGDDRVDVTITVVTNGEVPPEQIDVGDGTQVGASSFAARADHQHALPAPGNPQTTSNANAPGVSPKVAREDHVHRGVVAIQDEGVPVASVPAIDFVGAGVTATAGPGDKVTVTIPGSVGPDTDTTVLTWGNANVGAAADTRYLCPGRDNGGIALVGDVCQIPAPRAGTLRRLYVRHNTAGGNGNPVVYTVMKNGVATGITVSLVTGAVGQIADLVNTVAVVAGDLISIQLSKAAGIAAAGIDAQASLEIGY